MPTSSDSQRIVVLGGGFGGLYTTLHLERLLRDDPTVEVVLIGRENYFLMTPLLFEAGSGVLEPRHAVVPIRGLLRRARFVEATVESIDLDGRVIYAHHSPSDTPYEFHYDQVVLALGGVTNRQIIPGAGNARAFKTLADAIALRNHTIDMFERADAETDDERRAALLTFVVVGGGLVGVELMGEFTDFARQLAKSYPNVSPSALRFHLIEAGPRLLAEMDADLAAYASEVLRQRGVQIETDMPVQAIGPQAVYLPGERTIATETLVLAAGVAVNPVIRSLDLAHDAKGRVKVDATMRVAERPEVWALGDCAEIPDPEGKPYPPLAQHALREAKVLALNVVAGMRQAPLVPFVYRNKGTLAALGTFDGVGKLERFKIRGFLAWWVWRSYYLFQLPGFDRRLRVVLDWTVALFFKNDIVKLDYLDRASVARSPAGGPAAP